MSANPEANVNSRFFLLSLLPALLIQTADAAPRKSRVAETPVRATLGDGQILMGEVHTRTLLLRSGSGDLEIPLADVGEVVPATGGKLGEADGRVDVWLRNGSELRGTWADPKLAMSIRVGGAEVAIDLPMNDLSRFQLQGDARWPGGPIYRMKTRFGDDFLVDPARTHLIIENDLGTFSPLLSECQYVGPVDDPQGLWRVQLQTGTVLLGKLQDDKVTVALPMGPSEVSVPLEQFVSLRIESWSPVASARAQPELSRVDSGYPPEAVAPSDGGRVYAEAAPVSYEKDSRKVSSPGASVRPAMSRPEEVAPTDDWFDSSAMAETKNAQE